MLRFLFHTAPVHPAPQHFDVTREIKYVVHNSFSHLLLIPTTDPSSLSSGTKLFEISENFTWIEENGPVIESMFHFVGLQVHALKEPSRITNSSGYYGITQKKGPWRSRLNFLREPLCGAEQSFFFMGFLSIAVMTNKRRWRKHEMR